MEKEIKFYKYVDGINDTPFPSKESQIRTSSFTYNADRMGGTPSITATVMHKLCLDDYWNKYVYVQFNGEKYYVRNTPSSSKSNDDTRYKHEVELLSEREDLNHVYFVDAVQGDSSVDVYKSNTTKVTFMGDIVEFVARLNSSLQYSGLSYNAVIDSGITSEDKLVSFENKYIMEALQEIFNIYELPYYFVGKTIHIGYTENAIPNVMRYGRYDALLSISKDNANYLVINRITGTGGTDNIPYYYPNETDDRSQVDKWITPAQNLMPSVYRKSKGANLFYNAENNKYPDGEGGYYKFDNPYSQNNILEGSVSFPEIYPTIKEMTNGSGQRIDMFSAFAYDQNDNDEIDEETNEYIHPYFFAKLRKLDGPNGFNLFEQAIEQQAMQISMTSGVCGSCTFEIGVGEETNKNIVQVDDSGNLLRDENGNVLRSGSPQARQNDTKNYEVWIALKKDDTTFPIVMPNAQDNFRPSTSDTFVILGINLPQGYVTAAEDKLEQSLIKHMWMNNREKFTFSIKFSRIFFEENPTILSRLNENARLLIEYNGQQHTLYVNSFTYKMDESTPLPEIEVDLVDTLTVGSNSLQNRLDSVKQDILSSIGGADFLKQGLKYFLRKDVSDTAIGFLNFLGGGMVRKDLFFGREIEGEERYKISGELGDAYVRDIAGRLFTMRDGFQTDNFAAGMTGTGVGTYNKSELHMDKAIIRKYLEVLALVVAQMFYRGGRQVLSPAGMKVNRVEEGDTYYRLFMETEDGQKNEFTVGAQARCNRYSTVPRYWWRLVTAIGTDYIEVSKTDCDEGSMDPEVGDEVVQFGHRTDPYLQWVVMDSSYPDDAGRSIYGGVNTYSLDGKMILREGVDPKDPNRIGLFLRNGAEISDIINEIDESIGDITQVTEDLNSSVEETRNSLNNLIQQVIPDLQNQIDGAIQSWDGTVEPTLGNYPANEWTTDTERDRHVGDVYYYYTGEGTLTYKFRKKDDGTYTWERVADSETAAFEQDLRELAGIVGTKNSIHFTDNVPTPPYIINDLWVKTDGSMYTCIAERGEGQVGGAADWVLFNDTMVRLAQMASDSVISKEEKAVLRDNWAQVQKEYATYQTQASTYGVSITNLTNAYNSLSSYLTDTVKISSNTDTTLTVQQKSEYNTRWANYYSERTEFANIIADKIAHDVLAKTVQVTAPGQVFKYDAGYTGTPTPSSIVLTATAKNFTPSSYQWQYLNGSTWTNISGATSSTYTVQPSNTMLFPSGTTVRTFRCVCDEDTGKSDVFTLAKLADGAKGDTGKGVKSTSVTYQKSTSGTTAPTGSWSDTIPSVSAGQYLWTRTIITYTDNSTSTMYSVGKMGDIGTPGNDGKGVRSTAITYQASSSGTTAPSGTWSSTIPSVAAGQFLWTRTVITYTDGSTSTIYSVGKMGNTGSPGADAYTILLTNEAHTVACLSDGTPASGELAKAVTEVQVYKGTTKLTASTSSTPGSGQFYIGYFSPSGGSFTYNGASGIKCTAMTADTATCDFRINLESVTRYVEKTFVVTKAKAGEIGESLSGKMLYTDPTFKLGMNSVSKYSNSTDVEPDFIKSKLVVERIEKPSDCPTTSTHCIRVTCSAQQTPGFGGVHQSIQSRANATFIQKIIAKLPIGYKLNAASNSMGSGYTDVWLTSTEGTGKYETYLRKVTCGSSGTFSSGGHVYITGSPIPTEDEPLVWYIAYMTSFDQTDDGYEQIETASKDALAEKLGYGSWEEMVDKVSSAGSIIQGDYIRATLIDVETIAADNAFVDALMANTAFVNDIKGISFDFQKGKVGGFSIDANALWAGSKFGGGYGIEMQSKTDDYRISAYKGSDDYVELFYRTSGWGLQGFYDGSPVFQLGSTNKIGPFVFNTNSLEATTSETIGSTPYDNELTLYGDNIRFTAASGTIYQRQAIFGVNNISNMQHALLYVEGGDIYHQGTVGKDGRRSCRFYTNAMYFRNVEDSRQQISSSTWGPVVLPLACGSVYVGDVDQTKYVTVQIGKNVGTTNYIVLGSFQANAMGTMLNDNNLMFCTVLKGTTSFSIDITEGSGKTQTATFVWVIFPL